MSSDDITFLLGYQESNSFLRAFHLWTGMGFSEYRKTVQYNMKTQQPSLFDLDPMSAAVIP